MAIARFETRDAAEKFADESNVLGYAHHSLRDWIWVCPMPQGMVALNEDGKSGTVLEDW